MKQLITLLIIISPLQLLAEINVEVNWIQEDNQIRIFANNNEYCPVTIKMDLSTNNLRSSTSNGRTIVVPARAQDFTLDILTTINSNRSTRFKYNCTYNRGNHNQREYDKDYSYYLPFATNSTFKINQGYDGSYTHRNKNALDIDMFVGTPVHAARNGVVIDVVDNNEKRCTYAACGKYNNFIIIYHTDGTLAEYAHLKKNGSQVQVGDAISIGQIIGLSGNVGWSTGPHLHFEVFLQKLDKRRTVKTKFLTGSGDVAKVLKEGSSYTRNY